MNVKSLGNPGGKIFMGKQVGYEKGKYYHLLHPLYSMGNIYLLLNISVMYTYSLLLKYLFLEGMNKLKERMKGRIKSINGKREK